MKFLIKLSIAIFLYVYFFGNGVFIDNVFKTIEYLSISRDITVNKFIFTGIIGFLMIGASLYSNFRMKESHFLKKTLGCLHSLGFMIVATQALNIANLYISTFVNDLPSTLPIFINIILISIGVIGCVVVYQNDKTASN